MKNKKIIIASVLAVVLVGAVTVFASSKKSVTTIPETETVQETTEIVSTEPETETETTTEAETESEEETTTTVEIETVESTTEAPAVVDTIQIVEEMDTTMYGVKNGNIRVGDTTEAGVTGEISKNTEYHVTGKTANNWYRLDWGGNTVYCAASLLSTSKQSTPAASNSGTTQKPAATTPSTPAPAPQPETPKPSGGSDSHVNPDIIGTEGPGGHTYVDAQETWDIPGCNWD